MKGPIYNEEVTNLEKLIREAKQGAGGSPLRAPIRDALLKTLAVEAGAELSRLRVALRTGHIGRQQLRNLLAVAQTDAAALRVKLRALGAAEHYVK